MEPSFEVQTRRLLKTSADLQKQMAELRALREAIRRAEATLAVPEPRSAFVSPPRGPRHLARSSSDRETFSVRVD